MSNKFNLYIVKVETETMGTLFHKFESRKEIKKYLNNPLVLNHQIVKSFEKISFKRFCELWISNTAEEILKIS